MPSVTSVPGEKLGEITPNALAMNIIAGLLAVVFAILAVETVARLPHRVPAGGVDLILIVFGLPVLLGLHELVHALSLVVYAKLPWRAFKFGFNWRQLVLYCHCREAVPKPAFRVFALAPLAVLGGSTLLATALYPALWLAVVTGLHLAGCLGDVWLLLGLRKFPNDSLVLDLPDRIGCMVFQPAPIQVDRLNSPVLAQ